jgi:predicted AAA+ superfamily ATPase
MKRIIDYYLSNWKNDRYRKPLLLRGARQVGKTHAVRVLGATFPDFFEINLESQPIARTIFEKDLQPDRIIRELSALMLKSITPGKTLLFIDEIQAAPQAILALRYFYEQMPELHVIAAGSLLDFAIESVGMPVGRVDSFYMQPLSFIEFLAAMSSKILLEELLNHTTMNPISDIVHNKLLSLLGEYLAIGGMPQAVKCWQENKDVLGCPRFQRSILSAYRQDFGKYATRHQVKYVELLFQNIPKKSPYGIRFSTQNYSEHNKVRSYPLYAVCMLARWNRELQSAIEAL